MKSYIVVKEVNEPPKIEEIKRRNLTIGEAKEIVAKRIGCKFVDAINLYDSNDNYLGGIYCDDLALMKHPYNCTIRGNLVNGTIVVINETRQTSITEASKILITLLSNMED